MARPRTPRGKPPLGTPTSEPETRQVFNPETGRVERRTLEQAALLEQLAGIAAKPQRQAAPKTARIPTPSASDRASHLPSSSLTGEASPLSSAPPTGAETPTAAPSAAPETAEPRSTAADPTGPDASPLGDSTHPPARMGRPSLYSPQTAQEICERLIEGETLAQICRDPSMPSMKAVFNWLALHSDFEAAFSRARKLRGTLWEEQILEIADDSRNDWLQKETMFGAIVDVPNRELIERTKIRLDSRFRLMAIADPARYAPKTKHEHSGEMEVTHRIERMSPAEREADAAELLARAKRLAPPMLEATAEPVNEPEPAAEEKIETFQPVEPKHDR
jgi:hypothetical protein